MMDTKPIEFLEIEICKHCYPWTEPAHYEVPAKTHWGCKFGGNKREFHATEPCRITDYHICPFRKGRLSE